MNPDSASGLPYPRRRFAIAAILLATAVSVIDGAIANVALPSIGRYLGIDPENAVLIVTIYQLVFVTLVLPFASLGDVVGHRRLYEAGLLLFSAASLLCLFARSFGFLLLVRTLQALGGAALLSVSSALLRATIPAEQLGRGIALTGIVVASGNTIAPVLGGALLAVLPWQVIFAATVPFALLALLIGRRALPEPRRVAQSFDVRGALLICATFGLLVIGLQGFVYGRPVALSLAIVALGLATGFQLFRHQRAVERPILPLDMLRKRLFALSVLAAFLAFITQMLVLVTLPFRLEEELGLEPSHVGALLAPWPLAMMFVAPIAGMLSDRFPAALLGTCGMAATFVAAVATALLPADATAFDIGWRMALWGAGYGFFLSPNTRLIITSASLDRAASAGGMVSTTRLLGQTVGASLAAIFLAQGWGTGSAPASVAAVLAVVVAICSSARR